MKFNIWYFIIGLWLSGIAGYVASDLKIWELVISFMCVLVGVTFIERSNVLQALSKRFRK